MSPGTYLGRPSKTKHTSLIFLYQPTFDTVSKANCESHVEENRSAEAIPFLITDIFALSSPFFLMLSNLLVLSS
jgi:hypothetical protein